MQLSTAGNTYFQEIINCIMLCYSTCVNNDFFYGDASLIGGFGNWLVPLMMVRQNGISSVK
jgi:hypothetical protein